MGLAGTFSGHKNLKEGAWPLLLSPLAPLWAGAPGGTLLRGEVEGVQGGVDEWPRSPRWCRHILWGGGGGVWLTCLISGRMTSLSHISDTLPEVIGKPLEWPRDL